MELDNSYSNKPSYILQTNDQEHTGNTIVFCKICRNPVVGIGEHNGLQLNKARISDWLAKMHVPQRVLEPTQFAVVALITPFPHVQQLPEQLKRDDV